MNINNRNPKVKSSDVILMIVTAVLLVWTFRAIIGDIAGEDRCTADDLKQSPSSKIYQLCNK